MQLASRQREFSDVTRGLRRKLARRIGIRDATRAVFRPQARADGEKNRPNARACEDRRSVVSQRHFMSVTGGVIMTQRIGILDSTSAATLGDQYAAFQRGLKEVGYVDGDNVTIEFKFAENDYQRLDGLAARFVGDDDVAVIVAAGGPVSAVAAATATGDKAIVFTSVTDAVA